MRVFEDVFLTPDYEQGGWTVEQQGASQHFPNLGDAVECLLEFALVISIERAGAATELTARTLELRDAIEAFRDMIMSWYQIQVPDPHAVKDLNEIENDGY